MASCCIMTPIDLSILTTALWQVASLGGCHSGSYFYQGYPILISSDMFVNVPVCILFWLVLLHERRMMTIHSVRNDFSYAGISDWLDWWRAYEYPDHFVSISFRYYFDANNYCAPTKCLLGVQAQLEGKVSLWSWQDCWDKEKQLRMLTATKGTTEVIDHWLNNKKGYPMQDNNLTQFA